MQFQLFRFKPKRKLHIRYNSETLNRHIVYPGNLAVTIPSGQVKEY